MYIEGSQVIISKKYCIHFLALANSAGPDEMLHYATFHLALHCLPKYQFMGFWYTKGSCADSESFVRGGSTLTMFFFLVDEGR